MPIELIDLAKSRQFPNWQTAAGSQQEALLYGNPLERYGPQALAEARGVSWGSGLAATMNIMGSFDIPKSVWRNSTVSADLESDFNPHQYILNDPILKGDPQILHMAAMGQFDGSFSKEQFHYDLDQGRKYMADMETYSRQGWFQTGAGMLAGMVADPLNLLEFGAPFKLVKTSNTILRMAEFAAISGTLGVAMEKLHNEFQPVSNDPGWSNEVAAGGLSAAFGFAIGGATSPSGLLHVSNMLQSKLIKRTIADTRRILDMPLFETFTPEGLARAADGEKVLYSYKDAIDADVKWLNEIVEEDGLTRTGITVLHNPETRPLMQAITERYEAAGEPPPIFGLHKMQDNFNDLYMIETEAGPSLLREATASDLANNYAAKIMEKIAAPYSRLQSHVTPTGKLLNNTLERVIKATRTMSGSAATHTVGGRMSPLTGTHGPAMESMLRIAEEAKSEAIRGGRSIYVDAARELKKTGQTGFNYDGEIVAAGWRGGATRFRKTVSDYQRRISDAHEWPETVVPTDVHPAIKKAADLNTTYFNQAWIKLEEAGLIKVGPQAAAELADQINQMGFDIARSEALAAGRAGQVADVLESPGYSFKRVDDAMNAIQDELPDPFNIIDEAIDANARDVTGDNFLDEALFDGANFPIDPATWRQYSIGQQNRIKAAVRDRGIADVTANEDTVAALIDLVGERVYDQALDLVLGGKRGSKLGLAERVVREDSPFTSDQVFAAQLYILKETHAPPTVTRTRVMKKSGKVVQYEGQVIRDIVDPMDIPEGAHFTVFGEDATVLVDPIDGRMLEIGEVRYGIDELDTIPVERQSMSGWKAIEEPDQIPRDKFEQFWDENPGEGGRTEAEAREFMEAGAERTTEGETRIPAERIEEEGLPADATQARTETGVPTQKTHRSEQSRIRAKVKRLRKRQLVMQENQVKLEETVARMRDYLPVVFNIDNIRNNPNRFLGILRDEFREHDSIVDGKFVQPDQRPVLTDPLLKVTDYNAATIRRLSRVKTGEEGAKAATPATEMEELRGIISELTEGDLPRAMRERYRANLDDYYIIAAKNALDHLIDPDNAHGMAGGGGGQNPLKRRLMTVRYAKLGEFLINDTEVLLDRYHRSTMSRAATARAIQLNPQFWADAKLLDGTPITDSATMIKYVDELVGAIERTAILADTELGRTGRKMVGPKMTKLRKMLIENIEIPIKLLEGKSVVAKQGPAYSAMAYFGRNMLPIEFMNKLGSVAWSQLNDMAPKMLYALQRPGTMLQVPRIMRGLAAGGTSVHESYWRDLKILGVTLDTRARVRNITDQIDLPDGRGFGEGETRRISGNIEEGIQRLSDFTGRLSLMDWITNVSKQWDGVVMLDRSITYGKKMYKANMFVEGGEELTTALKKAGISQYDAERMNHIGFNVGRTRRYLQLVYQYGLTLDDKPVRLAHKSFADFLNSTAIVKPNFVEWNLKAKVDKDMLAVLSANMNREVNHFLTVTPGRFDRPLFMAKHPIIGNLFNQFQTFGMAFANQRIRPMTQMPATHQLWYLMNYMLLGGVSDAIASHFSGRRTFEETAMLWEEQPMGMMAVSMDRSGMMGWLGRPISFARGVGVRGAEPGDWRDMSGTTASRHGQPGKAWTYAGPAAADVDRALMVGVDMLNFFTGGAPPNSNTAYNAGKLIPMQNWIGLRMGNTITGLPITPESWVEDQRKTQEPRP